MKKSTLLIITFLILFASHEVFAAQRILVKSFTMVNIPANEPYGASISKQIENTFFDAGGYDPLTYEDVIASAALDAQRQSFGCNDDRCMKALLSAAKIDLIIYGSVKRTNNYMQITAKMLDKSNGTVELARIKTVKIRDLAYIDEASKVIAQYLLDGKEKKVTKFQDKMYVHEIVSERNATDIVLEKESGDSEDEFEKSVENYKEQRRGEIAGKTDILRFGFSKWGMTARDEGFNRAFERGTLFMTDLMIPFNAGQLSGTDMYFRYTYKSFPRRTIIQSGDDTISSDVMTLYNKDTNATYHLFDIGFRYRLGAYFLMTKFDLYALAAIRFGGGSNIGIGGFGGEMAFFQSMGVFIEYNRGIFEFGSPDINIEGNQIIAGISFKM